MSDAPPNSAHAGDDDTAAPIAPAAAAAPAVDDNLHSESDPVPDVAFIGETFKISSDMFDGLRGMGFSANAIKKAVACGCPSQETCVQWITMHAGHAELDTPTDTDAARVVVRHKRILTAEEKEAKVAELKAKIAANKERDRVDEMERNRVSERGRMQSGKAALEARGELEAQARAAANAERRKLKEQDIKAKEKITWQLHVDRFVRKGKTSEEAEKLATEEMDEAKKRKREEADVLMARMREAQEEESRKKAEAAKKPWDFSGVVAGTPAPPPTSQPKPCADIEAAEPSDPLPPATAAGFAALAAKMREANPTGADTAIATLRVIISNIAETPLDLKKRHLRATTSTYTGKIQPTPYALSFLKLAGFLVGTAANASTGVDEQIILMNTVVLRRLYAALDALV